MDSVRYKIRECQDQEKIESFLHQARIGYLGLVDGNLPYVVPLLLKQKKFIERA